MRMTIAQYTDRFGSAGSSVLVTVQAGGATASLFSDAAGTVPLANPLTVGANRVISFYATVGDYVLTESGNGTDRRVAHVAAPTGAGISQDTLDAAVAALAAVKQDSSTAATDSELAAAIATVNSTLSGKQDASTAATDAELAAAVSTINSSLSAKQDAATAATDSELAAAVATLNSALAAKQDGSTAATDTELAAAVATINSALATKQDSSTAATDSELAAAIAAVATAKVTKSAVALGTQAASQSGFTYYEVTAVCKRGLMSQLTITDDGSGKYDVDLRSAGAGGGGQFLAATDADGTYDISVPVYLEGDSSSSVWLGIKNKGSVSRTFTLASLRVEKFA